MVDIRGDDGAARGHLVAHELRGDVVRNFGAETFAIALTGGADAFSAKVLTNSDKLHLRGDNSRACILELGYREPVSSTQRCPFGGKLWN